MTLPEFDQEYRKLGYTALCGVDEAGRGPLAGPVFAAAVILPPDFAIDGLNDSKKLGEKKRESLYNIIVENALAFYVSSASEEEISRLNILQASLLAMKRAVEGLPILPDCVLADGNFASPADCPVIPVVKGDSKSAVIAAASILAKVERDRFMRLMDKAYPEYQFARHKGYPTKLHYETLNLYGPCPIHRETFLRKWRQLRLG